MKKQIIPITILCTIPLSAMGLALYCLETYDNVVHNESGFLVCAYCIGAFILSTVIWYYTKNTTRAANVVWIISTLILMFVFYVGCKIPFCVVCDQVSAEDLGFLIYWIKPEGFVD